MTDMMKGLIVMVFIVVLSATGCNAQSYDVNKALRDWVCSTGDGTACLSPNWPDLLRGRPPVEFVIDEYGRVVPKDLALRPDWLRRMAEFRKAHGQPAHAYWEDQDAPEGAAPGTKFRDAAERWRTQLSGD
jgi:hypothetical protein